MSTSTILNIQPLGFPWPTIDPFLFCAWHHDAYPKANVQMGPAASLAGRQIGQDFSRKDGWSMYHGEVVPGFPAHPHRGFETVTLVRRGLIDHSDSLGASARFGEGDVQWLTAGRGITHAEMFPLLHTDRDNPVELFQIWLNLPMARKMVPPYFTMFWEPQVPRVDLQDAAGHDITLRLVAGALPGQPAQKPPSPPPHSWAAQHDTDVAIWTLRLEPHARYTLPPALGPSTRRMLYVFSGQGITIDGHAQNDKAAIEVNAHHAVSLMNGPETTEILLLQGRPINEPVFQYGPFVMNTRAEIQQAFADYQKDQFGGWPWRQSGPVHGVDPLRFARHPDGRVEHPETDAVV